MQSLTTCLNKVVRFLRTACGRNGGNQAARRCCALFRSGLRCTLTTTPPWSSFSRYFGVILTVCLPSTARLLHQQLVQYQSCCIFQYVSYQVLLLITLIRTLHPRLVHVLHFEHQKRADTYLSFSAAREGCDSLDWQICWQEGCNCQKLRWWHIRPQVWSCGSLWIVQGAPQGLQLRSKA